MKTNKLLQLIQQKKFMRSGGALPLPKHQALTSQTGFNAQDKINNWLGNPMARADEAGNKVGEKWYNPQTKKWESEGRDNFRHPMAGRYVAEAITDKIPYFVPGRQLLGFLGSNALGVGHELIEPNRSPGYSWWDTIREGGEDAFNNMIGAGVGSLPLSDQQKTDMLLYLSDHNLIPDGYAQGNMYLKKQGGALPRAQTGIPLWQQLTNQALNQNNATSVRDQVASTAHPQVSQAIIKKKQNEQEQKDIKTYGSVERANTARAIKNSKDAQSQSKIYQKEEDRHYNPEQEEYRDDTTLAPEGSTRATAQDYLNKANMFMGFGLNPAAKFVYDGFVSGPTQSAINLSNTAMGDRPIRGDEDVVNFGWDVANVAPFIGAAARGTRKFINAFDQAGRMAFGALPEMGILPKSFGNLFEETGNITSSNLKNLKDLKEAQKFAKKYGYTLPSNLERIAESNVLTDRVVRGMMDRHNTFVRGVSTNWEELGKRSPKIIKDLEDLGFNLSTEEGSRQAAEYMSTHIPGQTGYGRFGLKPGENALYLSNSLPTAEGYTYGNGFIVKTKRPTDFSSVNRKDWITANEFDASLGFKNSPYGTGVVKNDYVKRLPTNWRELIAATGDPKTFDEVQKVIKKADEKYRDLAHTSWRDHNNKISKYVRERSAKARNNVWDYDGKIISDELNGFDEYYISLLEKKKNLLNAYYGNAPAIPIMKHILGNTDIWKSVGKNLFGQLDPFSHYAIKGQPGEKVLDAIQSIRVTPETWENTSRMHVNKYSNKLSRREEGGSLPMHQWLNSQVMAQPGPTQAKANFINSTALNMATQNSANILNQIMSNKKNQPFVNFVDTRITDPVVPGKNLEATRKHHVKGVSREELMKMVNQAKKLNTDPSTAITTALWETNMGQTDPNLVHDLHAIAPTEEGLDDFDARANMAMQAINRQLNIGKRKYPGGPFYKQMQAFQGYGPLYPHTERGYYKHNNQAFFGIPVTQDNPLRTNVVFPYGKTIENFRDSVVTPTLKDYGIELEEGGELSMAQEGQTVSQLWKEVTGTDWSKAKEMGLTDGSYEKNMEVRNALSKYMQSQPQPKKESKPAAPVYPWSPGGKYAHKDNARLVNAKEHKPEPMPVSRINELVGNAMNQNNPTPVDAIPNMNMKAVQDIGNLNSKGPRDDTKLAPEGSTRRKFQDALNSFNEMMEYQVGNPALNPVSRFVGDAFVAAPAQSALNIANTVKGDRPIRSDQDIANLGWDAVMVAPYVGEAFNIGKNAFNTTRRFISYNAIDPVNYGAWEKFKAMPRTFIRNITDPAGRPIRVGEELANQYGNTTSALRPTREGLGPTDAITRLDNRVAADLMEKEMLGKRRLDAWNIYLQRPQKYNTFTKVGDNTYKINELDWDDNMFKGIVKDINAAKRGRKPLFATQSAYDPAYEWSQYRDDPTGIMGGFRFDVRPAKSKSGNVFIRSQDVWDVQPWGKRGTVYSDPNMVDQNELMKHYNKFLENFEVGKVLGGKPFTIENNFLFSPSQNRTLRAWEEGGELTSEKALEMLHDGTANGKPLTAAQKRYFGYIANKNKTKRHG